MSKAIEAFGPAWGQGQQITTSTSTGNDILDSNGGKQDQIVVTNKDASIHVYVRTGSSTVVAAVDVDYLVLPGTQITLSKNLDDTHIAHIAESGTPEIHVIPGRGL